ncbi:MAG: VWA domain-containing protein [Verrucomicrobia bacterium]|nr:VWA domain-containing protein [Verrucomicrobiota bacterium]
MKKSILIIGLITGFAGYLPGADTLNLKLVPDRDVLRRGSPQEMIVKIDLSAIAQKQKSRRTPLNIAVVLDRSGSMTGAKIEKAKQAAIQLVDRLASDDVFSLVTYSDNSEVLVSAQRVEDKAGLKRRISRIEPGGSTALYSGVKTGAAQIEEYISAKRINRVMLLSDGLANIGPSSTRDLRGLGHQLAQKGIAVTTIGVGDDYNEDLMAGLAEASDANYYYVKDTEKLPEIFAKELGELQTVAAREIIIEIICPDGVKPIGFVARTEKFENRKATVKLSQFTIGQNRSLFFRCLVKNEAPEVARVKVRYVDELDGGNEQSVSEVVRVRFTDDETLAAKSVNAAVQAENELLMTAIAKDEALAEADAGNYADAAKKLAVQADALKAQYQNASPSVRIQISNETDNLLFRSKEFSDGKYSPSSRKALQWESYGTRNSK